MKVTSRERILKTLNHEEPDRVPIDIGGTLQTSMHKIAHKKLLEYLDYPFNELEETDIIQGLVRTDKRISKLFGNDCYAILPGVPNNWSLEIIEDKEASYFKNEWGITFKKPHNGFYYDVWKSPLSDGTMEALKNYHWPDGADPGRTEGLRERAKKAFNQTEYALIVADASWGTLLHASILVGFEKLYMSFFDNMKFVRTVFENMLEFEMAYWDSILPQVKEFIQIVQLGDDLGNQYATIISPKTYREHLKPLHKTLIEHIKKQCDAKIFFHSCGAVSEFIPDFIDIGVDALNPVQVSAKGMDTEKLKREFGRDITFWGGGCDTQKVLPLGTPEDVKKEVLKRISDMKSGGGFVFSTVHNIQAGVPPENIKIMYDTVLENGVY